MNKQLFSSAIGIILVVFHITLTAYILISFTSSEANVLEIVLPFSITFAIGVVKWVIDTQGHITSTETVGIVYVVIVCILLLAILVTLPFGLLLYQRDPRFTADSLDWFLAGVQAGFGAVFSLVYSDMFGKAAPSARAPGNQHDPSR